MLDADYLEGILELDSHCRVKKASEEACLIFGLPQAQLVGEQIQKVGGRMQPYGSQVLHLLLAICLAACLSGCLADWPVPA